MDEAAKKTVLRLFTYGLYAVTAYHDGRFAAFTANYLSQCAFSPPMVMVAVENDGVSLGVIRAAGVFAVNVYDEAQTDLAGQLGRHTRTHPHKTEGVRWEPGVTGAPLLPETLGAVECALRGELPAGDHTVLVAEVVEAHVHRAGSPLTMAATGWKHAG
jgi:flavin reductase (DIM6/NTAB) family NADH-FMN oxidoreductase RutF